MTVTLKYLFENLFEYETDFELLKDRCFDDFFDAVTKVRELFTSNIYRAQVEENTEIEYAFDFDAETKDIHHERAVFDGYVKKYLQRSNFSKLTLQEVLTEDWLDDVISTHEAFTEKVKIRLTDRLHRKLDRARMDLTDWYQDLIQQASAMIQFMSPIFLEERLRKMSIWKAPSVQVFEAEQINYTRKLII